MAKKLVQARVLVGFTLGIQAFEPNDLVQGAPGIIKAYEKDHFVDTDKDAVSYAVGLGAEIKNIEGDDSPEDKKTEAEIIAAFAAEEKAAFEKSGKTLADWQALPEADRNALIEAEKQQS